MALFGCVVAPGNDAEWSVRAVLAIQPHSLSSTQERGHRKVRAARIAIETGPVVVDAGVRFSATEQLPVVGDGHS